jgi:hypothetical protein
MKTLHNEVRPVMFDSSAIRRATCSGMFSKRHVSCNTCARGSEDMQSVVMEQQEGKSQYEARAEKGIVSVRGLPRPRPQGQARTIGSGEIGCTGTASTRTLP